MKKKKLKTSPIRNQSIRSERGSLRRSTPRGRYLFEWAEKGDYLAQNPGNEITTYKYLIVGEGQIRK